MKAEKNCYLCNLSVSNMAQNQQWKKDKAANGKEPNNAPWQWTQSMTPEMKPVMASYLNMARNNVYRTLLHISAKMQISEQGDEEKLTKFDLWKVLLKAPATEQMKLIKLLQKHFPVLQAFFNCEKKAGNAMVDTSAGDVRQFFVSMLLPALSRIRNEYTHFAATPRKKDEECKLRPYLRQALADSAPAVFDRFDVDVVNNDETARNKKPKQPKLVSEAVKKIFSDVFAKNGRKKGIYRLVNGQGFTDLGVVLFTCLFLERRYTAMFLDALKPWPKSFNEIACKAVFEVFSYCHIRLPREKYDSVTPDYALGLEMLNELQKCPAELFDILSAEDQERLSVDIKSDDPDAVTDDGVTVKGGKVQMKRVSDRFARMAMMYLDRTEAFKNLRFMIHLGNYRFKFYMKQCVADKEADTLRTLQKEINGFGRIDEIEAARRQMYAPMFKATVKKENVAGVEVEELQPDHAGMSPYVTDTKANYVFDNNRIGLRAIGGDREPRLYLPSLTENGEPIDDAKQIKLYTPNAWLSVYELPGLIFYKLLCDTYPEPAEKLGDAEKVIISYINAYRKLFKNISDDKFESWDEKRYSPLTLEDLPVKIKTYIQKPTESANPLFVLKSRAVIRELVEATEKEIEYFNKKLVRLTDKKVRPDKKTDLRPGAIASRLSRDIMYFAPKSEAKDKMTSANFNSLQSALALSKCTVKRMKAMVDELNHPFIGEAFDRYEAADFKIYDFYKLYLECRLDYLTSIEGADKKELMKLPFLHPDRAKWQKRDKKGIQELAGRYLKIGEVDFPHGFELPRGLFTARTEAIMHAAGVLTETAGERKPSMTNLINHYFTHVLEDDNQPFYCWSRHYEVFDRLAAKKDDKHPTPQFLSPAQLCEKMKERKKLRPSKFMLKKALESVNNGLPDEEHIKDFYDYRVTSLAKERLKKDYAEYDDNERMLRRFAVQDKLIFLMAKDILLGVGGIKKEALGRFKLKDVMPGAKDSILETTVPFVITLTVGDTTLTIRQKEEIKIKRYGEFYRYNSEPRLKSLLPYLTKKIGGNADAKLEIDREMLEDELSHYDLKRVDVMSMVQTFEKGIIKQAGKAGIRIDDDTLINFNNLITKIGHVPYEGQGKILINIRNGFCHNEYAKGISIPEETSLPEIAEQISTLFDTTRRLHTTSPEGKKE